MPWWRQKNCFIHHLAHHGAAGSNPRVNGPPIFWLYGGGCVQYAEKKELALPC